MNTFETENVQPGELEPGVIPEREPITVPPEPPPVPEEEPATPKPEQPPVPEEEPVAV